MNNKIKEEKIKLINKNLKLGIIVLGMLSIVMLIGSKSYALFTRTVETDNNVINITASDRLPKPKEGLGKDLLQYDIDTKKEVCNPIIEEDGITYLSGDNNCIDFNYVWYSGKLWRITSINSDGTIKMITQDEITLINWGANTTYQGSWMYQWLNEDFRDTLYNYQNIIVQDAEWNATEDGSDIPVKPRTDSSATIVKGDVGLLNAYEYYQSYKNLGSYSKSYMNIGYYAWSITPNPDLEIRGVGINGLNKLIPRSNGPGARPSINLKSDIKLSGEGTKSNPYIVIGDKATGTKGEFINTRLSGEYVEVDSKVYRIVEIENGTTKLTSVDYVRDKGNTVITKNFGSDKFWKTSVESKNEDYWGYYLNNIWLTDNLKQYITEGTYYLGEVGSGTTESYKNALCSTSNTNETTQNCEKTSSKWEGLVGLPRVGEMFAGQLGSGYDTSSSIWLITPHTSSSARSVDSRGFLAGDSPQSNAYAVRPSINLKSTVKITDGKGTEDKPYIVEVGN